MKHRVERTRPCPEEAPRAHRLLLRAYPRAFREQFGADLLKHLARQRQEPRYGTPLLGAARFWWEAGRDAVATGSRLRLEGAPGKGGAETMLETLWSDARHALRGLVRGPGYALVFVLTLGLGIGANAAIFSAVEAVLLRPLPNEHGDRLVYLRLSAPLAGTANVLFSVPEVEDFRERAPSLGAVAEFSALTFTMLGHETPRLVRAGIVTGNYFEVMGLAASLGRTIGREDDGAEAPAVIVLSNRYWRDVFGADPEVIGRTVDMNGRTATFVGVAEPTVPYPERTEIWVNLAASPHHLSASMSDDRTHRMTEVFARLAPGATVASARTEASTILKSLQEEHPEAYDPTAGYMVSVTPLKAQLTRRARPTLLLLFGTASLVLLIACANLANLTLTRVLRRDQELAVRVSLGASRGALRRQLLVESLLLSVAGAALGLAIAWLGLGLLQTFAARFTARASEIALDAPVLGYALLAAVGASAFFALLPPLPGDRMRGSLLRSGPRSIGGVGARRAQRALVVAQIGTSCVLLVGAGLLLRTIVHLYHLDPGFDTTRILTMDIPDRSGIPSTSAEARDRHLAILRDVAALPGVQATALSNAVPLTEGGLDFRAEISVEGYEPLSGTPTPTAGFRVVSPGYFALMGIDVVRGRPFVSTDVEGAQAVMVINESLARRYFGDRDPIGRRIAWSDPLLARWLGVDTGWRTVVGVAADTHDAGPDAGAKDMAYTPYPQIRLTGSLALRVGVDPASLVPAIRKAILAHGADQPIANITTLDEARDRSVAPRRLNAVLLATFALLALVIAAVGIGGVLAFSVGSRTREFGVRSALGAARHQIWSGVLAEGAMLAGIGLLLGCGVAAALVRFISGLLVGVPTLDPVTFVGVGVLLGLTAVVAAWAPAWRAARVSPTEALSEE